MVKNLPCNVGDPGLIPGKRRSCGEGNGYPLQYSCLENSMDRGAWWATWARMGSMQPGVAKSQTQQKHSHFHFSERRIPLVEDGRFQLWKWTTAMESHGWGIMWVCKWGHTFFLLINQHHTCELSLMRLSLFCAETISPVGHFKSDPMSGSASISSIRIRHQFADQYSS